MYTISAPTVLCINAFTEYPKVYPGCIFYPMLCWYSVLWLLGVGHNMLYAMTQGGVKQYLNLGMI
jgi:hypothetical protein